MDGLLKGRNTHGYSAHNEWEGEKVWGHPGCSLHTLATAALLMLGSAARGQKQHAGLRVNVILKDAKMAKEKSMEKVKS